VNTSVHVELANWVTEDMEIVFLLLGGTHRYAAPRSRPLQPEWQEESHSGAHGTKRTRRHRVSASKHRVLSSLFASCCVHTVTRDRYDINAYTEGVQSTP
jgi:hypothetical protein